MGTERIDRVESMPVFQLFMQLALDVEKATRDCRPDFRWLRIQSLRSSESVCANMAEGFYSQYSTEYLQCLYRCRREARETVVHVGYARDAAMLALSAAEDLLTRYEVACCQLTNLIASIERKIAARGKGKPPYGQVREGPEHALVPDDDMPMDGASPSTINHQPSTIAPDMPWS